MMYRDVNDCDVFPRAPERRERLRRKVGFTPGEQNPFLFVFFGGAADFIIFFFFSQNYKKTVFHPTKSNFNYFLRRKFICVQIMCFNLIYDII